MLLDGTLGLLVVGLGLAVGLLVVALGRGGSTGMPWPVPRVRVSLSYAPGVCGYTIVKFGPSQTYIILCCWGAQPCLETRLHQFLRRVSPCT